MTGPHGCRLRVARGTGGEVATSVRGVAAPWTGVVLLVALARPCRSPRLFAWARLFQPPPLRELVEFRELGRYLAGLVDVPPGVHPADRAVGEFTDQPAQPARLGDAHGELVLALDQQHPRQALGPQAQVRLLAGVVLVEGREPRGEQADHLVRGQDARLGQ